MNGPQPQPPALPEDETNSTAGEEDPGAALDDVVSPPAPAAPPAVVDPPAPSATRSGAHRPM